MPKNTMFSFHGERNQVEQNFLNNLTKECIEVVGLDVKYLPRTLVDVDKIFGEDRQSQFNEAHTIVMYPETYDNWNGEGDQFSFAGYTVRDEIVLSVSPIEFRDVTGLQNPTEGDLIYFPLGNGLFEITFVEKDSPFFPQGTQPKIEIKAALYRYNAEEFNTGHEEIDGANDVIDSVFNISPVELVEWRSDLSVTAGDEFKPTDPKYNFSFIALEDGNTGQTEPDWSQNVEDILDGDVTYRLGHVLSDNDIIETEADKFKDLDIENPFGDY